MRVPFIQDSHAPSTERQFWSHSSKVSPSPFQKKTVEVSSMKRHSHHHHLSLNREGRWGTTDDLITSFLHFSLFSTALWAAKSRPVHFLMLTSHLSSPVCLVFLSVSLCLARWFWPDLTNGRHDHTTAVCVSLQWSGSLYVARLPPGSWYGLPHWYEDRGLRAMTSVV